MRKKTIMGTILIVLLLASTMVHAGKNRNGNGFPSGKHYTLNVLGKNWEKGVSPDDCAVDLTCNPVVKSDSGHRIFIRLFKKTRIMLTEGEVFAVTDADGTDGKAGFMLPDPGNVIGNDGLAYLPGEACYQIFVRVHSPKGKAEMMSGLYNDSTGNYWFPSQEVVVLDQSKRPPNKATDITQELTTIYADMGEGLERVKIFDDKYYAYFWDVDNNGLRHFQLRFYPTEAC